ncbi:MAG: hypothetical protein AW07_02800 [Candidatus Accumulibacter sp. SK-11]|nr:MAG: hypothetical protein AW07_02800 [Candidatus Accumulibacter sp. SK-11]
MLAQGIDEAQPAATGNPHVATAASGWRGAVRTPPCSAQKHPRAQVCCRGQPLRALASHDFGKARRQLAERASMVKAASGGGAAQGFLAAGTQNEQPTAGDRPQQGIGQQAGPVVLHLLGRSGYPVDQGVEDVEGDDVVAVGERQPWCNGRPGRSPGAAGAASAASARRASEPGSGTSERTLVKTKRLSS